MKELIVHKDPHNFSTQERVTAIIAKNKSNPKAVQSVTFDFDPSSSDKHSAFHICTRISDLRSEHATQNVKFVFFLKKTRYVKRYETFFVKCRKLFQDRHPLYKSRRISFHSWRKS